MKGNSMNYTLGPWKLGKQFYVGQRDMVTLETEDGRNLIAHLGIPLPNGNANPIAAAPELLEALRPLVAIVNGGRVHKLKREGYLEAARAAIAKATGDA